MILFVMTCCEDFQADNEIAIEDDEETSNDSTFIDLDPEVALNIANR